MSEHSIVCVLGWEARFFFNLKDLVNQKRVSNILVFFDLRFKHQCKINKSQLITFCKSKEICLSFQEIFFGDLSKTWKCLQGAFSKCFIQNPILDISTMPRDIIWYSLHFLSSKKHSIQISYREPKEYSEWQTRQPCEPYLIFKHSGISVFGHPTSLILIPGFDTERTEQMISYFQPQKISLLYDPTTRFKNEELNTLRHEKLLSKNPNVSSNDVDYHSPIEIERVVCELIEEQKKDYNIILASLGPKLTAIPLLKAQIRFPEVGLSYAPSKEYHQVYSIGVGETHSDKFEALW